MPCADHDSRCIHASKTCRAARRRVDRATLPRNPCGRCAACRTCRTGGDANARMARAEHVGRTSASGTSPALERKGSGLQGSPRGPCGNGVRLGIRRLGARIRRRREFSRRLGRSRGAACGQPAHSPGPAVRASKRRPSLRGSRGSCGSLDAQRLRRSEAAHPSRHETRGRSSLSQNSRNAPCCLPTWCSHT